MARPMSRAPDEADEKPSGLNAGRYRPRQFFWQLGYYGQSAKSRRRPDGSRAALSDVRRLFHLGRFGDADMTASGLRHRIIDRLHEREQAAESGCHRSGRVLLDPLH